MNRSVSVGLVVFVAVTAGLCGPFGAAGVASASDLSPQSTATTQPTSLASAPADDVGSGDFDTTTFEITVHENGSATWTFRHEQRLDGEDEADARANFEAFADEFEAEETDLYNRFTDQAEAMTEGNDVVDREMEATNFDRSAGVDGQINPMGIVEMSFQWDGFAATDGDAVVVGDIFQNIYITDDQSMVVKPDGNLEFQSAEPDPEYVGSSMQDADLVQWSGEQEFLDGHPRVVLEPADDGTDGGTSPFTGNPSGGDDGVSWVVVTLAAIGALGLAVGGLWYYRSVDRTDDATDGAVSSTNGVTPGGHASPPDPGDQPEHTVADDELLTDEDRVVTLIEDNGGRMKQVAIVEETGWSKSKVSMLLSEMEDDGTISKLRVGRENIISLDGYEPEATKSPFEE